MGSRSRVRESRAGRDWIACTAARGPVLLLHVVWFDAWATANVGAIRGIRPFDPFPFPFLTMTVSLEAIFWPSSSSPARTDSRGMRTSAVISICRSIGSPSER